MSTLDIGSVIFGDIDTQISWLQGFVVIRVYTRTVHIYGFQGRQRSGPFIIVDPPPPCQRKKPAFFDKLRAVREGFGL